jgi:hypothetical protein
MLNIAAMLMNIGNVWNQLDSDPKKLLADQQAISSLLSPALFSPQMQQDMLQALIYGTFYANNGNQAATTAAVQNFASSNEPSFWRYPCFFKHALTGSIHG